MNAPQRPLRADGTEVDATFRVEEVDGAVTIVLEARGGKRGSAEAVTTMRHRGGSTRRGCGWCSSGCTRRG